MTRKLGSLGLVWVLSGSLAWAQQGGTVRGAVRADKPIAGATVVVTNTTFAAVTDEKGGYVIDNLPPGKYELRVSSPGYDDAVVQVEVSDGQTLDVTTPLARTFVGQEVVVTGSKFPEKRLDAPVTVEHVSQEDIAMSGGSNYGAALANVKGIDYADAGVNEKRISMRGFN